MSQYDVTIEDVTTVELDGTGSFDTLMRAMKLHLQAEYAAGRITGDKYAEAYIALSNQVMSQAIQFTLQSKLMSQKIKTEAAQTNDKIDGVVIGGTVGKQQGVLTAQAKGFKDDAMIKAAKQHFDAFAVSVSKDLVTAPPPSLNSDSIDKMMNAMVAQVSK